MRYLAASLLGLGFLPLSAQIFGPQITIDSASFTSVFSTDLNNDGVPDILTCSTGQSHISWFMGDGAGSFGPQQMISTDPNRDVIAADFDNDGDQDVLAA